MWNTGCKIICLGDPFRTLLSMGIVSLVAELNPLDPVSEPASIGLQPFDTLTREQQIAAVYEVGCALLCDETVAPEPALYRSATLLAVFRTLQKNLRQEILENDTVLRSLTLASHRALYGEIDHGINRESTDLERWDALLASLEKQLLDDRWFKVSERVMDFPHLVSKQLFKACESNEDYFLAVPEDPTYPQALLRVSRILTLCKARIELCICKKWHEDLLCRDICNDEKRFL